MNVKKSTSIFLISLATMISRILGLVREQIFAFLLGASHFSDAFIVAFRIPNLLRDLFAEGSLSTAFIPTFTKTLLHKGQKEAFHLANLVINFLLLTISVLIILGYFFTPNIIGLIAVGFKTDPQKFYLTLIMTRILLPFLLFVSCASVFMGILNTHNKFFISALAPAMFNVVIIFTGIVIMIIHPQDVNKAIIWSVGALLGGIVQFFIQVPSASKLGFRYRVVFDWRFQNEELRQVLKLMLPAVIGVAAVQINVFINTTIASLIKQTGSVSHWNYSFRLIQFPIGIFGVSIATVNTAMIAKDIAHKRLDSLKNNLAFALKMNSFLSIPSMVFLMVLGVPVIQLLFQHGRFDAVATHYTYQALLFSAPCLFFYSGVKIFAPVFYAMKKSYIAVVSSFLAVLANVIVSVGTYKVIGIKGLALGLSAAALVNFLFLLVMFIKYIGPIKGEQLFKSILKHSAVSVLMGIGGYLIYTYFRDSSFITAVLFPILTCGFIYFLFSYILKVKELSDFINIFASRFKKSSPKS